MGSFEDLGDSAKLGDCPTGKYVTHSGPQAKEMVKVVWRAPEHFTATVTVYATVVKVIKKPSSKVADIRLFLIIFFSGQEHFLGETAIVRNHSMKKSQKSA